MVRFHNMPMIIMARTSKNYQRPWLFWPGFFMGLKVGNRVGNDFLGKKKGAEISF